MQLFPIGRVYDFMGQRRIFAALSLLIVLSSLTSIFYPGLRFGTDFRGGTEVELAVTRVALGRAVRTKQHAR